MVLIVVLVLCVEGFSKSMLSLWLPFSKRLMLRYLNFEREDRVALYMFTDNALSFIFSFDLTCIQKTGLFFVFLNLLTSLTNALPHFQQKALILAGHRLLVTGFLIFLTHCCIVLLLPSSRFFYLDFRFSCRPS